MIRLDKKTLESMTKAQLVEYALALQAELSPDPAARLAGERRVEPAGPGPDTWRASGGRGED